MLRVAVHTSGTVDETKGLNRDLKRLEAKPQTTKQHQQHALVVFNIPSRCELCSFCSLETDGCLETFNSDSKLSSNS